MIQNDFPLPRAGEGEGEGKTLRATLTSPLPPLCQATARSNDSPERLLHSRILLSAS